MTVFFLKERGLGFTDINSKAQVWTDPQTVLSQNGRAVGTDAEKKRARSRVLY
jgi:hypothetical protein